MTPEAGWTPRSVCCVWASPPSPEERFGSSRAQELRPQPPGPQGGEATPALTGNNGIDNTIDLLWEIVLQFLKMVTESRVTQQFRIWYTPERNENRRGPRNWTGTCPVAIFTPANAGHLNGHQPALQCGVSAARDSHSRGP